VVSVFPGKSTTETRSLTEFTQRVETYYRQTPNGFNPSKSSEMLRKTQFWNNSIDVPDKI
jgi:hypothetical protein